MSLKASFQASAPPQNTSDTGKQRDKIVVCVESITKPLKASLDRAPRAVLQRGRRAAQLFKHTSGGLYYALHPTKGKCGSDESRDLTVGGLFKLVDELERVRGYVLSVVVAAIQILKDRCRPLVWDLLVLRLDLESLGERRWIKPELRTFPLVESVVPDEMNV